MEILIYISIAEIQISITFFPLDEDIHPDLHNLNRAKRTLRSP